MLTVSSGLDQGKVARLRSALKAQDGAIDFFFRGKTKLRGILPRSTEIPTTTISGGRAGKRGRQF